MANILAVAEVRGGELRKVALEAVTAARSLAASGEEVHAFVGGGPGIGATAGQLGEHGAAVVHVAEHESLGRSNNEGLAALITARVRDGNYRAVVFSASAQGRDVAPRVAGRLEVPIASDVLSVRLEGDALVATHFVYAGKIVATLRLRAAPAVVSVRPGAIAAEPAPAQGRVEMIAVQGDPGTGRLVVTEAGGGGGRKLDLSEAPVIVSGGRGLKAPENFRLVEELAEAFGNAAVGATRAVTDEGWRPHSDQIGQTGRQVSPDLYVAVGISGAIQHLAGMRTSRTIVAINKDKDAPIFKVADYGIVGDVLEVVPALTAAVLEAKKRS
jgi:electron transfer flavoprotein alpha subunit